MAVRTSFRLDEQKIERELLGRSGATGKVLGGFASLATKEINDTFRRRAGGAWWPVRSQIKPGGRDPAMQITAEKTKPHQIRPRRSSGVLVFEVSGTTVFTKLVNHPGSAVPTHLIEDGVKAAAGKFDSLNRLGLGE